jgi:hypothetical protein
MVRSRRWFDVVARVDDNKATRHKWRYTRSGCDACDGHNGTIREGEVGLMTMISEERRDRMTMTWTR